MKKAIVAFALSFIFLTDSYASDINTFTTLHVFGPSVAAGAGSSNPATLGFAALIAHDSGSLLTNYAGAGAGACDVANQQIFPSENPGDNFNPVYLIYQGDANAIATGINPAYEVDYNLCQQASLSWLAIPSTSKIMGNAATTTGAWSVDGWYQGLGINSYTNNSTATFTLTTTGGPIVLWYRESDSNPGTFTAQLDSGVAVPLTTQASPLVGGTTYGIFPLIWSNPLPGSHTVKVTVTSTTNPTNLVDIIAVGTTPALKLWRGLKVYIGGPVRFLNDQYSAETEEYRKINKENADYLNGLGLPVYNVPMMDEHGNYYVNSTSDLCGDILHPCDPGHRHLANAYEAAMNISPAGISTSMGGLIASPTVYTIGAGTYTTPSGAAMLHIRMVGGGGGATGNGSSPGGATSGGNTIFGASTAYGGTYSSGAFPGGPGGVFGCTYPINGSYGFSTPQAISANSPGGMGASSPLGLGMGGAGAAPGWGGGNATGHGSGGGGPGSNGAYSAGAGGGSGAACEMWIFSPSASYSWTVGAAGMGATAGGGGYVGGNGTTGEIIIEAY